MTDHIEQKHICAIDGETKRPCSQLLVIQMTNRDRHDLTLEILAAAKSGKKKTEIMTNVGLSSFQAKQYLGVLIDNKLLEIDQKKRYQTTKKGQEFLEKCEQCPLFKWDAQKRKDRS